MLDVSIGKFTLESLTTGMYSDARIVYREYIQNAVDSLEEAVADQLLEKSGVRIDIVVDDIKQYICVRDNGIGISASSAASVLLSVGKSQKRHSKNRGFRGIGRLGGMSYCDTLVFTTSAEGEQLSTKVTFDCKKLREMLVPDAFEELDLASVLSSVTTILQSEEAAHKHYFTVEMFDVDPLSGLLDYEDIEDYISQVAPLPYRSRIFARVTDIHRHVSEYGYTIEEFPVFIGKNDLDLEPIYKPNRNHFHSDRNKMKPDEILDVRYFSVLIDGVTCAVGWYAIGNWYGMISEDNIGGLRVRKGNILIGDAKTLNPIFKEPRFNGWVQGEVFVLSDGLIPNARRDDFERNELYFSFIEALSNEIGTEISSIIREASKRRNDPSGKVLASIKKTIAEAETSLKEGFNSSVDREKVLETLKQAEVSLKSTPVTPAQQELKKDLATKLTETQESVEVSRNYKINQVSSNLDRKSKKVLEIISNILSMKLSKFLVDEIMAEIIDAFERK